MDHLLLREKVAAAVAVEALSFLEKVAAFVAVEAELAELMAKAEEATARKRKLESELIEIFQDTGTQKVTANGRTAYLHRTLYARAKNGKASVIEALREAGLGDYINDDYNASRLAGYVREVEKNLTDGKGGADPADIIAALPEPLREVVAVGETYAIRTRKG